MMKGNKRRIWILGLAFIGGFLFFSPYLIRLNSIREIIAEQLRSQLYMQVDLNQIAWSWLPVPHISHINVEVSDERIRVTVPDASIYLNWSEALYGKLGIRKINLNRPDIQFKTLTFLQKDKEKYLILPSVLIVIKNGHLELPSDGILQKLSGNGPPLELVDVNADITLGHESIHVDLNTRLPFAAYLSAGIRFLLPGHELKSGNDSFLDLDIRAAEVNLSVVREKVLLLFGDNRIAARVCSIVRGGQAKKAGFLFKGKPEEIKNLNSMVITADVSGATIQVPKPALYLEDAFGPVKIENGILSGSTLSARLGNSYGKNGTLELGLAGENRVFKLGVDLYADLSELPALLHELVTFPKFREELAMVSNTSGSASGHLRIGDSLNDIVVKVRVTDVDGRSGYRRLMHPVKITDGQLQVMPREVRWNHVTGRIGPHEILDTKGMLKWNGEVALDVENLKASLDTSFFLTELLSHPAMEEKLSNILISAKGNMKVSELKVKGPALDPSSWKYSMTLDTGGLVFHSPFFAKSTALKSARVKVTNEKVVISESALRFSGDPLGLTAEFNHENWQDWTGWLEVRGKVDQDIAGWVKSKDWIPELFFPKTPCLLSPLRVSFKEDGTAVKGDILSNSGPKEKISTRIDLDLSARHLILKELNVVTPKEKARLSVNIKRSPDRQLAVDFQGGVSADTLSSILEKENLLSGYIKGPFSFVYQQSAPETARFQGELELSGFRWPVKSLETLKIINAKLDGLGNRAKIDSLTLALNGESAQATGQIAFSEAGIGLDLNLSSDLISWKNLQMLRGKDTIKQPSEKYGSEEGGALLIPLTTDIKFQIENFVYTENKKVLSEDKRPDPVDYIWEDLTGRVKLAPDGKRHVAVTSGKICGIETTGILPPSPESSTVFVLAGHQEKMLFEDIFPCLGFDFNKAEGPFILSAKLEGTPGNWKEGAVVLKSTDGRLMGMTVLTRILSIINVMDLFKKKVLDGFFTEGFKYTDLEIRGSIKDDVFIVEKAEIKGEGLNLFGTGSINLKKMEVNLIVLAAPFKVIDTTVSKILALGNGHKEMGKTVIAFPVGIKGPIKNPKITLLEPHAVGESFLNMVKKTFTFPFKIFSSMIP